MGMTGIAWSYEDPGGAAKVVKALQGAKADEKLKVKAGLIEGRSSTAKRSRDQLATMPGKNELRAHAARDAAGAARSSSSCCFKHPAQNFVYLLSAKERTKGLRATSRNVRQSRIV